MASKQMEKKNQQEKPSSKQEKKNIEPPNEKSPSKLTENLLSVANYKLHEDPNITAEDVNIVNFNADTSKVENIVCSLCDTHFIDKNGTVALCTLCNKETGKLCCFDNADHAAGKLVHAFHSWCLGDYVATNEKPNTFNCCPQCKGEGKIQHTTTNTRPAIGFDFGGVIIEPFPESKTESFEHLRVNPTPGAFEAIRELVEFFGPKNSFIVSKCGTTMEQRVVEWLRENDFYNRTSLPSPNVFFCRERKDKAPICKNLQITHFIDDRSDVLQHMVGIIPNLYHFVCEGFPDKTNEKPFNVDAYNYTKVHSWNELLKIIIVDKK